MTTTFDWPVQTSARFGGHFSGPMLLVQGSPAVLAHTIERLEQMPSLPWMRGTLVLTNVVEADRLHEFDDQMTIAAVTPSLNVTEILVRATKLGMISGRGVRMPARGDDGSEQRVTA